MGPSPRPSWIARSMGNSTKGDLYAYIQHINMLDLGRIQSNADSRVSIRAWCEADPLHIRMQVTLSFPEQS